MLYQTAMGKIEIKFNAIVSLIKHKNFDPIIFLML